MNPDIDSVAAVMRTRRQLVSRRNTPPYMTHSGGETMKKSRENEDCVRATILPHAHFNVNLDRFIVDMDCT